MADPEPYIRPKRDDVIESDDWNDIQIKARQELHAHDHTGGHSRALITGATIDPASIATLKQLAVTDSLAVNNRDVIGVIDTLAGRVGAVENAPPKLPLTGGTITGSLSVSGAFTAAGGIAQEPWQTPTLLGTWVRFQATNNAPGFFKDTCGVVRLRGVVKNGVIGQPIFALPAGYRPEMNELLVVATSSGFGRVDVMSDGKVIAVVGNPAWLSLDGLSFRAFQ